MGSAAAQTSKDAGVEPLLIVQNGLYGYIDHSGRIVIPPQYLWAGDFSDGMATVYLCGRNVSIDRQGNVWPLRLGPADALAPESSDGKAGFLDATGRWVIPPRYQDALPFSDGLAAVQVGGKWGFIDPSGKEVLAPRYDAAFYFNQGVAFVQSGDDRFQLIDKAGQVLARGLDMMNPPSEGLIAVSKGDKWGYLGLDGKFVIPPQFESVDSFSEGLATVRRGDKYGYIDRSGQVAVSFQFDRADQFLQGLAPVRLGDRSGFIDKSGQFVFELDFEYATGFMFGDASRFWTKDERFGYVLTSGKVIWGPVRGSPDHPPLFGWTEEDKEKSCEGVPGLLRQRIASFPPIPRD